jgi:hypothetical protein
VLDIALALDAKEPGDSEHMLKIRRRALILSAAALLSAISFTGVAVAAASRPTLLSTVPGDRSAFLVRPIAMSFTFDYRLYSTGHASVTDYIAGLNATLASVFHTAGRIRWRRWGATAVAGAAYFMGDETGHYIRRTVTIRAWRVRRDRYTRFTIDLGTRGIQR